MRLFAGILLWACLAVAQTAPPSTAAARAAHWRQDLDYFAQHFSNGRCTPAEIFHSPLTALQPCHQADFAKLYRPADFFKEISAIKESVDSLSDPQIVLRLAKLVAAGHVGHTYVVVPPLKLGFRPIPLAFHWYADGLAVVSTTPPYAAALGARVLRIGPITAEQALAAVAPYVSYENQTWLRVMSPSYLQKMQVLREIGAVNSDNAVEFQLAKPNREPFTISVKPREPDQKDLSMFDEVHIPPMLYRKNLKTSYWYEYLPDRKALYIQYNICENDPKKPMSDFARELFAFADVRAVARAIVDLRLNGGGDSRVIGPLKSGLRARNYPVFVLIGDGTFSSAQDNAIEMRRELHATLVGEPTGERPNGYGEVRRLTLPNSGVHIQYSTEYFHLMKDADPDALYPDINVPRTLADTLAGRDAALEAALAAPLGNARAAR